MELCLALCLCLNDQWLSSLGKIRASTDTSTDSELKYALFELRVVLEICMFHTSAGNNVWRGEEQPLPLSHASPQSGPSSLLAAY